MPPVLWRNATRKKAYEKLRLTPDQRQEIDAAIMALGSTPRPDGHKKLSGKFEGSYRIAVCSSYRVLYQISAEAIVIVEVADRKEAYR